MKRKDFIRSVATLAATGLLYDAKALPLSNSKLKIGLIGVNGMGWSNLNSILKLPHVECTALCDVDERVLDKRIAELRDRNITVKRYIDYKELLAGNTVDAVIIATPDHWHCLQMVDAVKAGKHVYVEKPIGNSIRECEVMVAAAKKYKKVVQVGQWQRSQQHFRDAVGFVHTGKLGKIRLVKAWAYQGWMKSIPVKPDEPVPTGVHYERWLGPAAKRPFNPNRFHFEFRWFWDYAGGLMTDWGVHMLDYALLGMKVSDPKSVMAAGGKFAYPDDAAETPDTLTSVFEFDGFNIQWEHANGIDLGPYNRNHGVAFIGNNGTLVVNREGWEVIPENGRMDAVSFQKSQDNGLDKHMVNFVDAIQRNSPTLLNAPIEAGAHIAIFSQMGNIAYRTGKKLYWDAAARAFTDPEANRLLTATYHNGYRLPAV
ncbi:putative dehydrogenase [Sphingobacterium allocomposti]|uniref:Putative dehydrogenase n=1 Tax=Sphingobacterium allocomposti TaxID=415956 RepID=A0A5S5D4K4_9SPHI|nr:Gfo/Idh/MocA family oxidoreductase [Sphingobacterium composti Yoo et al. 2007 non Ten et al. 2007]TYP90957.1 putative dehydrogenase [Sphingobacterium composti Yoo et al. 2007 non Ten et al. 2007]